MDRLSLIFVLVFLAETLVLNVCSAGSWGKWGELSGCSVTCGEGLIKRIRMWEPAEGESALDKPRTMTDSYSCNSGYCPVDGKWSGWGMWAKCSKVCGGGMKRRQRMCDNPAPQGKGKPCDGLDWEEEECNELPCPPLPSNFDIKMCNDKESYFMCDSGEMCVPLTEECNKNIQCHDGSDEEHCNRLVVNSGGGRYDTVRGRSGSSKNEAVSLILGLLFMMSLLIILL